MFSTIKKEVIKIKTLRELDKANKRYFEILNDFNDRTIDNIRVKSIYGMLREIGGLKVDYSWIKYWLEHIDYDKTEIDLVICRHDELDRMRRYLEDEIIENQEVQIVRRELA